MEVASLHTLILIEEDQQDIVEKIKQIMEKLNQFSFSYHQISSRFEIIMFDFIQFTIDGISWDMGIQLQEVLEELEKPIIFVGSEGSGLTDTSQLKKGRFDKYFRSLLFNKEKLEEFLMYFLPFTTVLDYCLTYWNDIIQEMDRLEDLEYLLLLTDYTPLKSILNERISELRPIIDQEEEKQRSLDEFF